MDSKKKYDQMVEDGEIQPKEKMEYSPINEIIQKAYENKFERAKYIWVLDFEIGEVFRYDISVLINKQNSWSPDHEACEAFLYGAGHNLTNCEWMVTSESDFNIK